MLTYTDWIKQLRRFTGLSQDEATGVGTVWLNQGRAQVLKAIGSYITENSFTAQTVNSQQDYALPIRTNKISNVSVLQGSVLYSPQEVTDQLIWNRINIQTTPTSTVPQWYYVDKRRLSLFPIPSDDDGVITATITEIEPDLNQPDIIVGAISATNGSAEVIGLSTNWSSAQIGWSMLMPDGLWYTVEEVADANTLTLTKLYEGADTSGADYRLGQTSIIPEEGQMLPVYYASMIYYVTVEKEPKAALYRKLYVGDPQVKDGLSGLIEQYRTKTTTRLTPGSEAGIYPLDINLFPQSIPYADE